MLERFKAAIKRFGTQKKFCEDIGIREATLSEFLGGGDIRFSTLKKIMEKAGFEISSSEPNQLMPRDYIIIDGDRFHVGDFTQDKLQVEFCFGSTHTSKQGAVLKNVETKEVELIIL